ncbi:uncharacterized protein PHACADRAFT_160976 [Phanerochaete carnosa HHB-10118-sp]|uniref:RING-type domain-containing protein n=1 Tax=Phanerochaete carnosa (strain HHB-10118-sp) TaxID=650164 RepID=K5W7A1_PHACS|nr:uncharacterized protein PHACADRAFT_160976 [Phanerochaete carnosa HHB-10118-sp]EKM55050.1 hypothetical protein PHACADRAFT_160976 [Phanerochaete carnosa HHB-10118-sp]
MPCGHLYCLACASFWFHQGDAPQPCVICRKNFTGGDIIKLWLTTESQTSQTPEPAAGDGQISAAAQEVLDACEAAAANVGAKEEDEALAIALSK